MDKKLKSTVLFFLLSFAWTWIFYFAIILNGLNPYQGMGMVFLICGGCSPTFVGIILVLATYSKPDKKEYFKRAYQAGRIKPLMWIFIIVLFPVIFAVCIGLDMLMGGTLPQMTNLLAVAANPIVFLPLIGLSFMSGPFSEEFGWRGFALDPLLSRFGFVKASFLLGLIWAVWHLPLYFMPQTWHGQMGFGFTGFPMFILMSIGLSCIMSLVYLKSKRSILSAMLMHLFSNFTGQLLANVSTNVELMRGIIVFAIGVGICIYVSAKSKDPAFLADTAIATPKAQTAL